MNPWTLFWGIAGLAMLASLPRPVPAQEATDPPQGLRRIEMLTAHHRLTRSR